MSKSTKPGKPVNKVNQMPEQTPEEKKANYLKAYMQKKASLAEGILFNLVRGNAGIAETIDPEKVAHFADETAKAFLKEVYNLDLTIVEEEETEGQKKEED